MPKFSVIIFQTLSFFMSSWLTIIQTDNRQTLYTTCFIRLVVTSVLLFKNLQLLKSSFTASPSHVKPVGWSCRIHRLDLCRGVRPHPLNEYTGYDMKSSDSQTPVMLALWGMRSISSLPSLLGPLWFWVVAPDKVLSIGRIELSDI